MRKNKNSFINGLAMKTLALFNENQDSTGSKCGGENAKTDKKTCDKVTNNETTDGTSSGTSCPVDIPALKTHHLQRSLQTPEDGKILIVSLGIHQRAI